MGSGGRIIRGYWDCPYCESKDIDGLVDDCPNCGRHKPENTKYHMKMGPGGRARDCDVLSETELNAAGISKEECDGEHKEWVCDYCNSLNNWIDEICAACGSPRSDATQEYGMKKFPHNITESKELMSELKIIDDKLAQDSGNHHDTAAVDTRPSLWSSIKHKLASNKKQIIGWSIAGIIGILGAYLFWPLQETQTATDFAWDRTIIVEEERTDRESGWSVPAGGRTYRTTEEIHHYEQVVDYYKTVEEEKSRQVLDHYDTVTVDRTREVIDHYEYTYTDNGNGTFTEDSYPVYKTEHYTDTEQKPVYRTEYYTETHREPVYKDEPVYQTKYYYEIDRFYQDFRSESSGMDKNPWWNTDYTLTDKQRDSLRFENYYVYYTDEDGEVSSIETDYDKWLRIDYGDQIIVTTSRIGIDYKIETIEK